MPKLTKSWCNRYICAVIPRCVVWHDWPSDPFWWRLWCNKYIWMASRHCAEDYDWPGDLCAWKLSCNKYTGTAFLLQEGEGEKENLLDQNSNENDANEWKIAACSVQIKSKRTSALHQHSEINWHENSEEAPIENSKALFTGMEWHVLPVCCRTWFNKCSFLVNVFRQVSHLCGDSPEKNFLGQRFWFNSLSCEVIDHHTGMLPDMVQQMLLPCKCFRAKVTSMIRFAGMPEYVIGEMLFASETFPTNLTSERGFLRSEGIIRTATKMTLYWQRTWVCDRIWLAKCSFRVYFLLHIEHWWGVVPLCHREWFM